MNFRKFFAAVVKPKVQSAHDPYDPEEERLLREKMDRIEQLMQELGAIDPMEGDLDQIEAILDELDRLDPLDPPADFVKEA